MPLAHILAPELLRKAQELEDALGPPVPPGANGYLQVGYEKTPYDPKGIVDKPEPKPYDQGAPAGRYLSGVGQMQRSEDPLQQAFGNGYAGALKTYEGSTQPIPNALPPEAGPRVIGTNERGEPIYANAGGPQPPTPPAKKGRVVLPYGRNAPIGIDEHGDSTTLAGRKLGYLDAGVWGPAAARPGTPTEMGSNDVRHADRRTNDVSTSRHEAGDKYGNDALQRKYGKHLKAMQENRDANGMPTDRFPAGYFKGMSDVQKKNIVEAVKELQRRDKLNTEGTST